MTLALLWANPIVRKGIGIACVVLMFVAFVLAVRHHWIDLGQQQGQEKAFAVADSSNVAAKVADRDVLTPQLQIINNQIQVLAQQVANQQQNFLLLAQQRQQVTQQVASMTPEQVQAAINQSLGKPATSTEFTIDDKRRSLECFQQLPICNQQVQVNQAIIQELRDSEVKNVDRFNLLVGYTGRVEQAYATLYNERVIPKRKWYCGFLCKKKATIKAPDPNDLMKVKP